MRMVTEKLNEAGVDVGLIRRIGGRWRIPPTGPIDTLIRWGSIARSGGSNTTYNRARGIRSASDKGGARLLLQENDIPVPRTVQRWADLSGLAELNYPVVVRPNRHNGGNQFFLCDNAVEVGRACAKIGLRLEPYYSEFYPKQNEYRVHVVSGRVLIVNEKVPRDGEEHRREEPIWNHSTNNFYFQVLRWRDWPIEVIKVAIAATKALGLDFAGVDVMANAPDREPAVVCEVNTAPSVNEPYSSDKYAAYFKWLLQESREWEEINSNHAPDYAFRGEL
jgi:glutathione synthase/RimK-type ligase-like ATP-grasp enzyme